MTSPRPASWITAQPPAAPAPWPTAAAVRPTAAAARPTGPAAGPAARPFAAWACAAHSSAEPTAKTALQQGERQSGDDSSGRGRTGQGQRAKHRLPGHPEDLHGRRRGLRLGRGRGRQLGLLEGGGNGQNPPPADGGDDHERPAHHMVLRDGPVTRVLGVAAGVPGHAAMVAHHPQPARRDSDAELLLRRHVTRVEVGLLAERHAVNRDLAQPVAAGHVVTGYPDDPLDVVVHARRGAEEPGDRVPETAEQRRRLRLDRIPGPVAVEHHDVAAVDRPEVVDKLVDQHLVADFQSVLHRRRRNVERLDHEALDEQGQNQGEDQQYGQLDPPRHVRPPLPAPPGPRFLHGVAARAGRSGAPCPVAACFTGPAAGHYPGTVTSGAVPEGPGGGTGPRRRRPAVEPHCVGPRIRAITVNATRPVAAGNGAELLTADLARPGMSVVCGQLLPPRVPVVVHRIEPSAGCPQRRFGRRAGSLTPVPSAPFPLVGCTRLLLRWRFAALPDPGSLAAQRPEVVQLGPAHPAAAYDLDLVDGRAVDRKGPLHPHAVADLADGERLPCPAALAPDNHALEDLDPGPAALNDPDVHLQRVSRPEARNVGANLRLFQVGDGGVHGWRSSVILAHAPVRHAAMHGYGLSWSLRAKTSPPGENSARRLFQCAISSPGTGKPASWSTCRSRLSRASPGSAAIRSGRSAAVRRSASSRRHRAMAAWSPDSRTGGTSRPRHTRGLVKTGPSSRLAIGPSPPPNESSGAEAALPSTPGSSRQIASIITSTAGSPPDST